MPQAKAAPPALPSETQPPTPQQAIGRAMQHYRPVITKLLRDTGINEETFTAQVANACRTNPQLLKCSTESVLGAALRCAQLGLAPNDVRNLAWIIPYGNEATFQIGYGGVMELARRAVPGLKFDGHAVYPNDDFDLDYGRGEQPLTHKPAVAKQQPRGGEAYAWWVRARYPDGTEQIHVLDREQVEYHRAFSKQKNGGMWKDSYDAAALKSTVLDMKRWLPSSAQLVAALASDEEVIDVRNIGDIDHTPVRDDVDEVTGEIAPAPAEDARSATANEEPPIWDANDPNDPTREQS